MQHSSWLWLLLFLVGCSAPQRGFLLDSSDPGSARVRYSNGQISSNDTCMVRLGRGLSPMSGPIYVNGTPVGFC
ncbi:MAG: hypothetical protein AAF682_27435 [Planctomycetota bacterium]